jgi:hypothetical protein
LTIPRFRESDFIHCATNQKNNRRHRCDLPRQIAGVWWSARLKVNRTFAAKIIYRPNKLGNVDLACGEEGTFITDRRPARQRSKRSNS